MSKPCAGLPRAPGLSPCHLLLSLRCLRAGRLQPASVFHAGSANHSQDLQLLLGVERATLSASHLQGFSAGLEHTALLQSEAGGYFLLHTPLLQAADAGLGRRGGDGEVATHSTSGLRLICVLQSWRVLLWLLVQPPTAGGFCPVPLHIRTASTGSG